MKFYEVFKSGSYPQGKFTPEQIELLVKNYDPKFSEAPITLDHLQSGPAYGWVSSLKSENGILKASFKDLSPELKDFVQSGKYKKISVEIYRNLDGKSPYLKAVSFLGASIPQVKGLETVEFKEGESDTFEFEMNEEVETFSQAEIDSLYAQIDDLNNQIATFKESNKKTETIKSLKERIQALTNEVATFKEQATGKEEIEKELNDIKTVIKQKEFDEFVEKQIDKGILVPANKEVVVSVLKELDNIKKFGEETDTIKDFKSFIETLPKQIEFEEIAKKGKTSNSDTDAEQFTNADTESVEIFKEAKALAKKENISFKEALLKINI